MNWTTETQFSSDASNFYPEELRKAPNEEMLVKLRDELHSRTFPVFTSPVVVTSYSYLRTRATITHEIAHVEELIKQSDIELISQNPNRMRLAGPHFNLRVDFYNEFTCYQFIFENKPETDFKHELMSLIPQDWFADISGTLLVSMNFITQKCPTDEIDKAKFLDYFGDVQIIGSHTSQGAARAWSNFIADSNKRINVLVEDQTLGPRRLGRLIQRLIDIENYRMMSLLALPVAQKSHHQIERMEQELTQIVMRLSDMGSIEHETNMLTHLYQLAAQNEQIRAHTLYRFSASSAYQLILDERLAELEDSSIKGYQTITGFYFRRMRPALRTCESAQKRLEQISNHLQRVTEMLSTSVNVCVGKQNQSMLETLAQQSKMQLRMQQTVEGLSIVAITYYASSLLTYLFKSMEKLGMVSSPYLWTGLSVPAIALMTWLGLRWLKNRALRPDD